MAGCDYHHCEVCGAKTFYDAEVTYPDEIKVVSLCGKCVKSYSIQVIGKCHPETLFESTDDA